MIYKFNNRVKQKDHIKSLWSKSALILLLLNSINAHAFSAYSNDELDQLEKQFVQEINQSNSVMRDPLAIDYINHLAQILAQPSNMGRVDFFIVKSKEINAFAGPGGHIGVNSQLILVSENESELAGVMAHEMAHVRQHHLYRMLEHQKQMRIPMLASILASIALGVINPTLGSGAMMGALSGFSQDSINYVRSNEKEADSIGIDMLIKSGLDPRGMANFFKKMQEATRYYYMDNIPAILRTHPLDEDRIAEAENRSMGVTKKYYPDNMQYRLFKELVRVEVSQDDKRLTEFYKNLCQKSNPKYACEYGYVLTSIKIGNSKTAIQNLKPLLNANPDNLFYQITMVHALEATGNYAESVNIMSSLYRNYPENYTIISEYGDALLDNKNIDKAISVYLNGHRQFKHDIPICEKLARAEAANHNKSYAYFTLAECHIIQGEIQDAVRKLKLAKTLVGKDVFLKERIDAKIAEITYKAPD